DSYVADTANARVQELSPDGKFIAMFGKEVNATNKGDICTAVEAAVKCKAGVAGEEAGAFARPQSVVVEPAGTEENLYVENTGDWSIDKYSSNGAFLLRIGKEVNETKDHTSGA